VWPHLIKREYIGAAGTTLFIMVWSILQNALSRRSPNPNVTPNPSKAPWYFVGLQELLVYFDPWIAGVLLPGLIIVGLIAIPYIEHEPEGRRLLRLEGAQVRQLDVHARHRDVVHPDLHRQLLPRPELTRSTRRGRAGSS